MSEHLKYAKSLLSLAEGREGPIDVHHATQLIIASALISIAGSLEIIAEQVESNPLAERIEHLEDVLQRHLELSN